MSFDEHRESHRPAKPTELPDVPAPRPPGGLISNMPRRCSHCMQWIASKQEGIGMCAHLTLKLPHTFGCTEWKPTKNRKANRYSEGAR